MSRGKLSPPRSGVERQRRRGSALVASLHEALTAKKFPAVKANNEKPPQQHQLQSPSSRGKRRIEKGRRIVKADIATRHVIEAAPISPTKEVVWRHQLECRLRKRTHSSLSLEDPISKKRVQLSPASSFEGRSTRSSAARSGSTANPTSFIDLTKDLVLSSSLSKSSSKSRSSKTSQKPSTKHTGNAVVPYTKHNDMPTKHRRRNYKNSNSHNSKNSGLGSSALVKPGEAANETQGARRLLHRGSVVSRTPHMQTNSSNGVVVTEESSFSDHSSSRDGSVGARAQKKNGKLVAYKKCVSTKHNAKNNHRSHLKRELLALGCSVTAPTKILKAVPERSNDQRRNRAATVFYIPRSDGAGLTRAEHAYATAKDLSPPRQKRHRVAIAFYKPAADAEKSESITTNEEAEREQDSAAASTDRTLSPSIAANLKNRRNRRLVLDDSTTVANTAAVEVYNRFSLRSTEEADTENTSPSLDDDSTIAANMKKRPRRAAVQVTVNGADIRATTSDPAELQSHIKPCAARSGKSALDESNAEAPSHTILLARYEKLVAQGRCEVVHFGNTLASAKAAVDRKIKSLEKKCGDDVEDLEVMDDLREFKRSLRSFSVYEDREKLALAEEQQKDLEALRREASKRTKLNSYNHELMEASKLAKHPVVFSMKARMASRNNFCAEGPNCGLCGNDAEKQAIAHAYRAPIPHIRQIDIDADTDTDSEEPKSKRRRTRLPKLVAPVDTSKATLMVLMELKHSLAFVAEYSSSTSFPVV